MKKNLIKILGLKEDANEADIYARIGELKAMAGDFGKPNAITVSDAGFTIDTMPLHFTSEPKYKNGTGFFGM